MTELTVSRPPEAAGIRTVGRRRRTNWLVPAGLIFLSLVPVFAGALRLTELIGGAEVTSSNERFFVSPAPVIIHIVAASTFLLIGAFQFVPSLRRSRRGRTSWHRMVGRAVLVPAGLLAALSALWMTVFYPHTWEDGGALFYLRLFFGSAMVVSIVLAVLAVRRRDFSTHGAWMTRGYAIGLGAGTQVFTFLPWTLALGAPSPAVTAALMAAGWVINLVVAEFVIRRRGRRRAVAGSSALVS